MKTVEYDSDMQRYKRHPEPVVTLQTFYKRRSKGLSREDSIAVRAVLTEEQSKEKRKAYFRQWYDKNKARKIHQNLSWIKAHPEAAKRYLEKKALLRGRREPLSPEEKLRRRRIYSKRFYQSHKEEMQESIKARQKKNPEKRKEYAQRQYNKRTPERMAQRSRASIKRKAANREKVREYEKISRQRKKAKVISVTATSLFFK